MPSLKISQLTPGAPAQAGDLLPIARSGANYSLKVSDISAFGTVATANLTAQSAAISATTIYAVVNTGMYIVSWSASINTAASTSSVLGGNNGYQVIFTSPTDSVVKTTASINSVASSANTTGTAISGVLAVYAAASTNIQHTFDYVSVGGTAMVYELHVKVEAL